MWIERFREWLATHLLQPLSQLMETAHEEPNSLMARLVPGGALVHGVHRLCVCTDGFADSAYQGSTSLVVT